MVHPRSRFWWDAPLSHFAGILLWSLWSLASWGFEGLAGQDHVQNASAGLMWSCGWYIYIHYIYISIAYLLLVVPSLILWCQSSLIKASSPSSRLYRNKRRTGAMQQDMRHINVFQRVLPRWGEFYLYDLIPPKPISKYGTALFHNFANPQTETLAHLGPGRKRWESQGDPITRDHCPSCAAFLDFARTAKCPNLRGALWLRLRSGSTGQLGSGLDARGRQESMALDDKGVMQVDFDEESRNYVTRLGTFLSV